MKFQIHGMRNLSSKQQAKIIEALTKGCPLLDLPIWEDKIMKSVMTETRGMSNADIVKFIRSGADDETKTPDNDIDIDVTGFWRPFSSIAGYTFLNGFRQWISTVFLNKSSVARVFQDLIHEGMHKIGFTHDAAVMFSSVPYTVGTACREAYDEYYATHSAPPSISSFMEKPQSVTFTIVD